MKRRQFLHSSGTLAAGLTFGFPRFGFGNPLPRNKHPFVLIRTFGGMDATLGLDPQILPPGADSEDMFVEYRPEEILSAGEMRFGPAAKPLLPWASECLVVNGVMMRRDAGHDVILQYMSTGLGNGKAAAIPAELAIASGDGPFGVVATGSVYGAGKAVNISATGDILSETNENQLTEWIEEKLTFFASENGSSLEEAEKDFVAGKESALQMQKILAEYKKAGIPLDGRHAIAAAFASGGAWHAQLDLFFNLDTHSNHEGTHIQSQTQLWEQITSLFSLFKAIPYGNSTLFDATTFMVVSEWSRTPYLNPAKGKDHNPMTNSVLFAGRGIRRGTTLGKSRLITRKQTGNLAEHIAWPFDYKEQKLAESISGASFIFPENIVKTVGQAIAGPSGISAIPSSIPTLAGIFV